MAFEVNEKQSAQYTATLKDETGAVVPSTSLSSATLTLYNKSDGTIINSRNVQNVLNANGVTIDINGLLTWVLQPADNAIVVDKHVLEKHIALFVFAWSAGARQLTYEVEIFVRNLGKLT